MLIILTLVKYLRIIETPFVLQILFTTISSDSLVKGPDTVHFFKDKWLILLSLNDSVLRVNSL